VGAEHTAGEGMLPKKREREREERKKEGGSQREDRKRKQRNEESNCTVYLDTDALMYSFVHKLAKLCKFILF